MIVLRLSLTTLLTYGVFTETGWWTALSLLFIAVGIECHSHAIKMHNMYISDEIRKENQRMEMKEKLWKPPAL
jgi:hypothetical protein